MDCPACGGLGTIDAAKPLHAVSDDRPDTSKGGEVLAPCPRCNGKGDIEIARDEPRRPGGGEPRR